MEITQIEKSGVNEQKLTISVNAEEFEEAIKEAYKKNGKRYVVPGFRNGKAPRAFVEKYYGKDVFYQDAVNHSYGAAYEWAVMESKIEPVDSASIELVSCGEEGYTFTATVTVKPEVEIKNYKGIKAEKTIHAVTEDEVNAEIERYRERSARLVSVEDRAAELGDETHIDFEGFKDGVAFEGGKGEHYPLTLGSGTFIPGFEDQVVGHNIGDEFDVNVTFPEDYQEESLKGAAVVFKCKLHEIKHKELPEADDELAKDVSDFDTLEELKADVKNHLQEHADGHAEADVENSIIDKLLENFKAEIPECMINVRINDLAHDFEHRLQQSGLDLNTYLQYTGADEKAWLEGFKPSAERQVKVRLALEKIAQLEGIVISDEERDEEYKKICDSYKMSLEQVKAIVSDRDLNTDLSVEKAMKFVRDNAKITEKSEKEEKPAKKAVAKKATKKVAEKEEAPATEPDEKPATETEEKKPAKRSGKGKSPAKEKAE